MHSLPGDEAFTFLFRSWNSFSALGSEEELLSLLHQALPNSMLFLFIRKGDAQAKGECHDTATSPGYTPS